MKKLGLLICLAASAAPAVSPYIGIRAMQPTADELASVYHVLPTLSLGASFRRSPLLAVAGELSGTYARGTGDFSNLSFWDASVRFGAELNANVALDAYLVPGVMLTYASERGPYADTLGNIGFRSYGGSGLGVFLNAGVLLFRAGGWNLNVECGGDMASVLTDRPPSGSMQFRYSGYSYNSIPLYGLHLGLVLRKGETPTSSGR